MKGNLLYMSALRAFSTRAAGYTGMAQFLTNGHYRMVSEVATVEEANDRDRYVRAIRTWKGSYDDYAALADRAISYVNAALNGARSTS